MSAEMADNSEIRMRRRIMAKRVAEESKTEPTLMWDKNKSKVNVVWKLSGKNLATVELTFKNGAGQSVLVQSEVRTSSPEGRSADSPQKHAERFALADAIDAAIDQGWREGMALGKVKREKDGAQQVIITEAALLKYKNALNSVGIKLSTEKEPCHSGRGFVKRGTQPCGDLLDALNIKPPKHRIYHIANWDNTPKERDKAIKQARNKYYQETDYAAQKQYEADNPDKIREAARQGREIVAKSSSQTSEATRETKDEDESARLQEETSIKATQPSKTEKTKKRRKTVESASVVEEVKRLEESISTPTEKTAAISERSVQASERARSRSQEEASDSTPAKRRKSASALTFSYKKLLALKHPYLFKKKNSKQKKKDKKKRDEDRNNSI